jgi:DNA-binding transcriptional LysR family regulator
LAAHAIVLGPGPSGPRIWEFTREGGHTSLRVEGRLACSSNEGAIAGAVAGLGVANTSIWGCRAELERGVLVRLLDDWLMEPMPAHAIYPLGRPASPAARAFVEYLATTWQNDVPARQPP